MIELKSINDIKRMEHGASVEGFEATVTWVDDPQEPTPGQAKAGIHKQKLTVEDDSGSSMKVVLMKPHIHIGRDSKGMKLHFESTPNDQGTVSGLVVTKWTNTKNNKTYTDVEANGSANIYVLPGQEKPKQQPKPQQQAQRPANTQAAPPATQQRQAPPRAAEQRPLTLLDYALFHRLCFEAAVEAYQGTNVGEDELRGVATTIFIETKGRISQFYTPPEEVRDAAESEEDDQIPGLEQQPEPNPDLEPDPEPEPEVEKPKTPSAEEKAKAKFGKKLVKNLNETELTGLLIKCMDYKGDDVKAKAVQFAAAERRAELNLSYEMVYDSYSEQLKAGFKEEAVNTTYDQMRGESENEQFCKNILLDKKTFESAVEITQAAMEKLDAEPVQEETPEEAGHDPFV